MSFQRRNVGRLESMLSEAVILITFQFLVPKPFRLRIAQALHLVFLIFRIAAFEEIDLRVALESEDVGGNAVEEPAVVADDDCAACEVL